MVKEKRHVVVVCGYGCHLDTPLQPYLNRVWNFLFPKNYNQPPWGEYQPRAVILCGGYTQRKSAPGTSEAGLMKTYLVDMVSANHWPKFLQVFVEDESYTTYANIQNAAWWIGNWFIRRGIFGDEKVRITIFCEATRAANVIMLARHFMGDFVDSIDDITVETASWERADPFKQASNLIYNKLATTYPWLGLAEREHRRRIRRSEQI